MADKTREEIEQEANEAATKAGEDFAAEQRKAAEKHRADNPEQGETEEEYYERVRLASTTGIFGDTDTTAGGGAVGIDVPSANNEQATVAVAQADSADADSAEADATKDEARRQVDVAGAQPSGDQVKDEAPADDKKEEADKPAKSTRSSK